MANEKPKHKPQKKRTLEEVLKSLQDLVRNDLVSSRPARQTWRESGREEQVPNAAGNEPDTFHKALFKLDQIINEKIIEPVERAQQTPPEPLLPDEVIEIEWDVDQPVAQNAADDQQTDIATEDLAALDRASASLETIEIGPLEPPPDPSLAERDALAPAEETLEAAPAEPIEEAQSESIEIEAIAPPESPIDESIDLAPAPESADVPDLQRGFDFNAPASAGPTEPPTKPPVETPPATIALAENPDSRLSDDLTIVDLSEDAAVASDKPEEPPERPEVLTVESRSAVKRDAYTVEFTVQSTAPEPIIPKTPNAEAKAAASIRSDTPTKDDAHQPPKDSAVKGRNPPRDSARTPGKPPERQRETPASPGSAGAPEEIPVLNEVADISAPTAPTLPAATHARDIAIRVIAKLNIERRKAGEKPLDIKTIERLQQYLADALSKRALNKPK